VDRINLYEKGQSLPKHIKQQTCKHCTFAHTSRQLRKSTRDSDENEGIDRVAIREIKPISSPNSIVSDRSSCTILVLCKTPVSGVEIFLIRLAKCEDRSFGWAGDSDSRLTMGSGAVTL
jgi:hypothetical protein